MPFNLQTLRSELGYKLPWQDWLELSTADTIFYDKNKSLNGLNNNISNYSNSNGYFIRMLLEADVTTNGITTTYIDSSGNFEVFNRETDDQDPDAYTCEINTYDKNGNALENNIINKDFTELRAIITPTSPPIFTQNIDFTEVDTIWKRMAFGNKYLRNPPLPGATERFPNWFNEQADNNDIFQSSFPLTDL